METLCPGGHNHCDGQPARRTCREKNDISRRSHSAGARITAVLTDDGARPGHGSLRFQLLDFLVDLCCSFVVELLFVGSQFAEQAEELAGVDPFLVGDVLEDLDGPGVIG